MNKNKIIQQTIEFIKSRLDGEGTGHDWFHVERVYKLALSIGKKERADEFIVSLGALLHDVADWKFFKGDTKKGGKVAREFLENLGVEEGVIGQVVDIVDNVSFKGEGEENNMRSIEGKVVQDADRIDAIGAVGIARVFTYGGSVGDTIYDPNILPVKNKKFKDYSAHARWSLEARRNPVSGGELHRKKVTSINHFFEKLLLLKDLMNTQTAKKIASQRDKYTREYLERFFDEWEGKI